MNRGRVALASLAVFIVAVVLDGIVHGVLLADLYRQTASVWRPEAEMQGLMGLMWIADVVFAVAFVLIYVKGYEAHKNRAGQGLRYGLLMGVLIMVPQSLGWYAVLPIPGLLAAAWLAAGLVQFVIEGLTVGVVYRPF